MPDLIETLIKEGLDPSKTGAITTTEGPLLVIAGPGSGKTRMLVERTVYLIHQGVAPEHIMVATFTEKAAKELITRISDRLLRLGIPVNLNEMYIGTLHSIFLRFLEEFREFTRLKRSYRMLDDFDQKYFLFRNLEEYLKVEDAEALLGNHKVSAWEKAGTLSALLGKAAEECLDLAALAQSGDPGVRALGEFSKIYARQLSEENALDFSAIQSETFFLLENRPEALARLQEKIRYVMVDEYQDTNTIQERILLLLAASHHNICVVGDDDQSLYRFRGATVRNILEFERNFPPGACRRETLITNYRSHPGIISFYNGWMTQCDWTGDGKSFRFDKTIRPREDAFPAGPAVIKVSCDGEWEDYYVEVYQFIRYLKQSGALTDYNQIAFLFKSVKNERVIGLANFLEERGIPIFSPRSALFFEREEIQLLLGAIIFVFPNLFEDLKWSENAKLAVWDYYAHCKERFANEVRNNPELHKDLLKWCQRRAKEHLTLSSNTNYAFAALLYQLLEYPMFARFLEADLNGHKVHLRAAYNVAMLSKLFFKFEYIYNVTVFTADNIVPTLRNLFNFFLRFIIDGGIEEYEDFDEYAPSGCVSFMTIHQSKGLEFPVVVAGSLNLVPVKQYTETDVILQNEYYAKPPFEPIERTKYFDFWRLFYTAFSRPQNLLVLTAREKEGQGRSPSKYFDPVFQALPAWRDPLFDPASLSLDSVKPVNLKHEFSFTSHILLYENCPLQYKFYKELEFVEVRTGGVMGGSLLHQTIEDIHKAILRGEGHESLTNERIQGWFDENYRLLVKQQRSYLHQGQLRSLLSQILRYRDRNRDQWDRLKEAEVDVSLVKEGYILRGKIDLIKGEDGTVELIDFKSGDKPDVNTADPIARRRLQQYRRQLEVYAHLVEERTGHKVSKMHLYYPKEEEGNPHITFPSNKHNIDATIQSFDEVVKKIETRNFDMSHIVKSEKQCGDCDMRFHCNPRQYTNS